MFRLKTDKTSPWAWVPSLYLTQALPYMLVMSVSVVMYKNLGLSNVKIAAYTSLLNLPWVIKPLWSPVVDWFKTKRYWMVTAQLLMGVLMAGLGFVLPLPFFFQASMAILLLLAFTSATHDIAADGFYMVGLTEDDQSYFVGVRSIFYRVGMLLMQGPLVFFTGYLASHWTADYAKVWMVTFSLVGLILILMGVYHYFICPKPLTDRAVGTEEGNGFMVTFLSFFLKKRIGVALAFILLFRLGEAQLVKMVAPFMLDPVAKGGLGLSNEAQGIIYGTYGVLSLLAGGFIGGYLISKSGLKRWILWMCLLLNIPNLGYALLAHFQPPQAFWVSITVIVEQFGYGFGFSALMMYMIYIADGAMKASHYALCTGFMALGVMLPSMLSGWVQTEIGYTGFFVYVFLCGIPAILLVPFLGIPADFGRKVKG